MLSDNMMVAAMAVEDADHDCSSNSIRNDGVADIGKTTLL